MLVAAFLVVRLDPDDSSQVQELPAVLDADVDGNHDGRLRSSCTSWRLRLVGSVHSLDAHWSGNSMGIDDLPGSDLSLFVRSEIGGEGRLAR